jgi:serine-type D-Ala-D-Ala carboxypeptidase (penicillin-binding protein 5/6)
VTPRPPSPVAALVAVLLAAVLAAAAPASAQERPAVRGAEGAIAVETTTGAVTFSRAPDRARPIASATKLMTALLALEGAALEDVLTTVPYDAAPAESVAGLTAGERISVRDLLRALLLASANDAAQTLAVGIAGSEAAFVREMNARARALGLESTRFEDPIGLSPRNRSSPRDLVTLARILRRRSFFRRTVDLPRAVLTTGARRRVVQNRNLLVRGVPFVDGIKTGRTNDAGYVLVGSGTRGGVSIVTAVLGEPSESARNSDTLALLRHGLSRFRRATLVRRGQPLGRAALEYRDETVGLVAGRTLRRVIPRGQRTQLRVLGAPDELDGPLRAGARVGTVEVRSGGRRLAAVPLVTAAPVEEASFGTRLASLMSQPVSVVLVALVLACSLLLVLLRRRMARRSGGAP